jgi:hypothetical protein
MYPTKKTATSLVVVHAILRDAAGETSSRLAHYACVSLGTISLATSYHLWLQTAPSWVWNGAPQKDIRNVAARASARYQTRAGPLFRRTYHREKAVSVPHVPFDASRHGASRLLRCWVVRRRCTFVKEEQTFVLA